MTTLTSLPIAPSRGSAPGVFITTADAFLAALPRLVSEFNTAKLEIESDANLAEQSAASAAALSSASPWNSGQVYEQFSAVISRVDYQTYRRKTASGSSATDPANDPTNWASLTSVPPVGVSRVQGLKGSGTGGNGLTYTLSAVAVALRNSQNQIVVRSSTGNISCNAGNAGPVANGRDQFEAFPSSSMVHLYFIWNGSTLSTICSLTGPNLGPTLPSGYTHWAYASTVSMSGATFRPIALQGCHAFFQSNIQTVASNTGSGGTWNVSSSIPAIAAKFFGFMRGLLSANSSSLATINMHVFSAAGNDYVLRMNTGGPSLQTDEQLTFECANIDQTLTHNKSGANSAIASFIGAIYIRGYTVPNGDN
jgi:hypothetical protein